MISLVYEGPKYFTSVSLTMSASARAGIWITASCGAPLSMVGSARTSTVTSMAEIIPPPKSSLLRMGDEADALHRLPLRLLCDVVDDARLLGVDFLFSESEFWAITGIVEDREGGD